MKEKIKSISHSEKMFWMRVRPTSKSLVYIHQILMGYDDFRYGLSMPEKEFKPIYSRFVNTDMDFFADNECGYIFFSKTHISIILRKETKMFEKLKAAFLAKFELMKPKYSAKKTSTWRDKRIKRVVPKK